MKTKQIIGIVAAGLVFVFVGISSMVSNYFSKQIMNTSDVMDTLAAVSTNLNLPAEPYIGLVKVEGTISDATTTSLLGTTVGYDHEATMDYIDQMIDSKENKGIMLYVDSPGGTVYHSDELYLKLMEYKEKTKRPIWTYMATQACSGGYYISMASDHILANRNCWTGSIGVIISLLNIQELYEKFGIKEIDIASGPNKTMGSQGLKVTEEHKEILQSLVDESYEQFVEIVAEGRNMSVETVKPIADGRIYSALQAKELGLLDGIETYENAMALFEEEVGGDVTVFEPEENTYSMFSSLFSAFKGSTTKTDVQLLSEMLKNQGNGVPMYYAEPGK